MKILILIAVILFLIFMYHGISIIIFCLEKIKEDNDKFEIMWNTDLMDKHVKKLLILYLVISLIGIIVEYLGG